MPRVNRIFLSAVAAMVLVSTEIEALEFSVIGGPVNAVIDLGETVTIDLAIDNLSESTVQGISAAVTGLGDGLVATAGQMAVYHLAAFCQSPTMCFGGLGQTSGAFFNPNDLPASASYTPGDDSIVVLNVLGLTPTTQTGALDPGLDGTARDITLQLTGVEAGTYVLELEGTFSDGVNVVPFANVALGTVTVAVIPEPGTALLIGLGLAGLRLSRRRE